MRESAPSRTALRVALRRAAHQLLDSPKVLDDPLAVAIVGEAVTEIDHERARHQSAEATRFRAFMVARSRYAEDQLAESIARGATQYVVLGAGLDTSAYRGIALSNVNVFEVDHPNTQVWKKERLAAASIAVPASVRYVSVDFEQQELAHELQATGFRLDQKTFISWLGVVPYLTKEAAAHTFGLIGKLPAGTGVVFDYAVSRSSLGFLERLALDALSRRVARAGEPFHLFFAPDELEGFLVGLGFHRIEQLAAEEINARYFANRKDGLCVAGSAGRIVSAWT
ncbi:MAG TPA: class I SAM-dependent methyltransferase [Candidatus Sulfotelmatobacter sp.]|nr:class I SAM-dependent methyltransferase [Candidatus Sulfotelmatobacter sp.]